VTTYYRSPEALITHEMFAVYGPYSQIFPIEELFDVYVVTEGSRVRPRAFQLWGTFRGTEVLLFSCSSPRTFGQVKRGLIRALEGRRYREEQCGVSGYR
jgi:hypothetical protein